MSEPADHPSDGNRKLLTVREAAARLCVTPQTVRNLFRDGVLSGEDHGTLILIDVASVGREHNRRFTVNISKGKESTDARTVKARRRKNHDRRRSDCDNG